VIEPGSTIKTDGAPVLRRLADRGFVHHATPAYSAADQSSTASNNSTCPTTLTSTPSASTGAPRPAAACASTGYCNKP
jgi:hypothetical protein